jgi:hypothetical protein
MALDPKAFQDWKRRATQDVADGPRGDDWPASVVLALLAEVERLRSEAGLVRDPAGGEPPSWVRIEVRAHDPEQRKRTAEWIRRADEDNAAMRALLREVEWSVSDRAERSFCPACRGRRPTPGYDDEHETVGHAPDCRLKALLK